MEKFSTKPAYIQSCLCSLGFLISISYIKHLTLHPSIIFLNFLKRDTLVRTQKCSPEAVQGDANLRRTSRVQSPLLSAEIEAVPI